MRKNVLLLETIAEEAYHILEGQVNLFTGYDDTSVKKVLEKQTIHAIITRGKGQINKSLLEACPDLLVAARCGVGLDNVDVQEATLRNIKVIHAPASNAATIAEHTLALMLVLMRDLYQSITEVKNNNWNWRNQYTGDELHGKTLGIIGMGHIGQRVAKLGDAFGMRVMYSSRTTKDVPYLHLPLDSLLAQADVVSLHIPYSAQTGSVIGAPQLALMKSNALLINTARGALIDHNALIHALDTGIIAGFAADVLPEEPPQQNARIVKHPRVLITPHSGSLTATTYQQMCVSTIKNVLAVLQGQNPENKSVYNLSALHPQP